jgi:hypothetical protein
MTAAVRGSVSCASLQRRGNDNGSICGLVTFEFLTCCCGLFVDDNPAG